MNHIQIESVIEKIFTHYEQYLKEENDGLLLIDPNDEKLIGFHYGETHLGVAMIIWGMVVKDDRWVDKGKKIIKGFLSHIDEYQKQPAYHWDFNNFAICLLVNYLKGELKNVRNDMHSHNCDENHELCNELQTFIIKQNDSNNPTINWIPMRIYVNYCKYLWTGNKKYKNLLDNLAKNVRDAQYTDGFYEDLLPKGKSFNFQYHLYTTAVVHFLETQGIKKFDNAKANQQAINIIDPCGDMNYLGRGINQIFAWGPALYLYQGINAPDALQKTWDYFSKRIDIAINNNNLILNEMPGSQKIWWWDYHYASVYFSHLVFWLILGQISESNKNRFEFIRIPEKDSGVNIIETEHYQVCVFEGRKHYLAESGPLVANICGKDRHYVFKGAFGPFAGDYGNHYGISTQTIHNYFGLIQEKIVMGYLLEKPVISKSIFVEESNGQLLLQLDLGKKYKSIRVNLPLLCNVDQVKVIYDGNQQLKLKNSGSIVGAYGQTSLYVSELISASKIEIRITR